MTACVTLGAIRIERHPFYFILKRMWWRPPIRRCEISGAHKATWSYAWSLRHSTLDFDACFDTARTECASRFDASTLYLLAHHEHDTYHPPDKRRKKETMAMVVQLLSNPSLCNSLLAYCHCKHLHRQSVLRLAVFDFDFECPSFFGSRGAITCCLFV